jgi:putative protein kinase ArgK-like GTPase of G3E family
VVSTVSIHDIGIEHLWSMVEKHRQFQEEKGLTREGHQVRLEQEVLAPQGGQSLQQIKKRLDKINKKMHG